MSGGGSQITSFNRWGDYSSMSIDPADECTFWYTQEYYANTNDFDFKTRVGSFKFPSCVTPARGGLKGRRHGRDEPDRGRRGHRGGLEPDDGRGGSLFLRHTAGGQLRHDRHEAGLRPGSVLGVVVTDGATTVQNFILVPTDGTLQGTVTDGTNPIQGATVTADGSSTLTDAAGFYSMTLLREPTT